MAYTFALFSWLSLAALTISPILLVLAIQKLNRDEIPSVECLLLSACGFVLWVWFLIVFSSLPAP
ncbi:MAG: hypothetical protein RBQ94_02190 [Methanimicrococcus sp.]|nr:hypothetical protein [Methanimicrococcus sp.]